MGQVTSGVVYWSDGTPVAGQQFGYAFDSIGNRQSTTAGGDQAGGSLRSASYTANNLNQYTARTVPNALDIIGSATNAATVTVNGQTAYRHDDYYRVELGVSNSAGPVFQAVTNLAALTIDTNNISTNIVGNVFVPQTPENFAYDPDGNLTNDGRWTYSWDAENRLIAMTNNANVPDAARITLSFVYDYLGRRVQKTVSTYNPTTMGYETTLQNSFVYDGWNLAAELNSTNDGVVRSYVWGLDLSGSPQGAGGVGGLLWTFQPQLGNARAFATYDGNGNVSGLVHCLDGSAVGQYEYGPFGEVIRATGPMARVNPFRWSTQYTDDETDLVMYPARPYNPSTGRFLCKDPIGERGGLNLYAYCGNSPINRIDPFGLDDDSSPWLLGWEWLTGTGPEQHNFVNGDNFTELLKKHQRIEKLRKKLREQLEAQCAKCDTSKLADNDDYRLNGLQGVPKYLEDYSTLLTGGLTGNLAVTFLGSYSLSYDTRRISCRKGIAVVHFHVYNASTIESATHPPVIGYTQWWSDWIGKPLNDFFSSGPLSKKEQTFDWTENLDFKGNPCCKK